MNKLTRKLVLSVLTLVLSIVALGTTSFAWFSIGSQAEIQAFDVQATAGEGLEITVTKKGDVFNAETAIWYSSIPTSVMEDAIGDFKVKADGSNSRLDAITSKNGYVFVGFNNGAIDATKVVSGKYLSFNLHFRTRSVNAIYWTGASITGTTATKDVDVDFGDLEVDNNDTYTGAIANALRIAIVSNGDAALVFENPADDTNTVLNTGGAVNVTDANAHTYFKAKTGNLPEGHATVSTVATSTVLDNDTNAKKIVATQTVDGEGFNVSTVTVNIWIEGWDAEAFDFIYDLFATIALTFELLVE